MINPTQRDPLAWLVVGVTTLVWVATAGQAILTASFTLFEIATGPYLLVVGWVTGVKVFSKRHEDPKDDERWSHLE